METESDITCPMMICRRVINDIVDQIFHVPTTEENVKTILDDLVSEVVTRSEVNALDQDDCVPLASRKKRVRKRPLQHPDFHYGELDVVIRPRLVSSSCGSGYDTDDSKPLKKKCIKIEDTERDDDIEVISERFQCRKCRLWFDITSRSLVKANWCGQCYDRKHTIGLVNSRIIQIDPNERGVWKYIVKNITPKLRVSLDHRPVLNWKEKLAIEALLEKQEEEKRKEEEEQSQVELVEQPTENNDVEILEEEPEMDAISLAIKQKERELLEANEPKTSPVKKEFWSSIEITKVPPAGHNVAKLESLFKRPCIIPTFSILKTNIPQSPEEVPTVLTCFICSSKVKGSLESFGHHLVKELKIPVNFVGAKVMECNKGQCAHGIEFRDDLPIKTMSHIHHMAFYQYMTTMIKEKGLSKVFGTSSSTTGGGSSFVCKKCSVVSQKFSDYCHHECKPKSHEDKKILFSPLKSVLNSNEVVSVGQGPDKSAPDLVISQEEYKIPLDFKCLLCGVIAKDDFNGHLLNRHFRKEILSKISTFRFDCKKCSKSCKGQIDLMSHLVESHGEALRLYFEKVGKVETNTPNLEVVIKKVEKECALEKNNSNEIVSEINGTAETCIKPKVAIDNEESPKVKRFFSCKLCQDPAKKLFDYGTETSLRNHIIGQHLGSALRSHLTKHLDSITNCPDCQLKFDSSQILSVHFSTSHSKAQFSDTENESALASRMEKQCPTCQEFFDDFEDMFNHCSKQHTWLLDEWLDRIKMKKMLEPVTELKDENLASKAQQNSLTKDLRAIRRSKQSSNIIENGESDRKLLSQIASNKMQQQQQQTSVLKKSNKVNGVLPHNKVKNENPKNLVTCRICGFEEVEPDPVAREKVLAEHLTMHHFHQTLVRNIEKENANKKTQFYKCIHPHCTHVQQSIDDMVRHVGITHSRSMKKYNKMIIRGVPMKKSKEELLGPTTTTKDNYGNEDDRLECFDFDSIPKVRRELIIKTQLEMRDYKFGGYKGQVFVQSHPCYLTDKRLPQCHSCAEANRKPDMEDEDVICQFESFRKIVFCSAGRVFRPAGFLDPINDPKESDMMLWLPFKNRDPNLSPESAKFILEEVGSEFCQIVKDEEQMRLEYLDCHQDRKVIWKKMQEKVREMCDVCSTSLFNLHFTCPQCCVLVCLDCYKTRRKDKSTAYSTQPNLANPYRSRRRVGKDRDSFSWPYCNGRGNEHKLDDMLLTQIVFNDSLVLMRDYVHQIRKKNGTECFCLKEDANCKNVAQETERSPLVALRNELSRQSSSSGFEDIDMLTTQDEIKSTCSSSLGESAEESSSQLDSCILCDTKFNPKKHKVIRQNHQVRHVQHEIRKKFKIGNSSPHECLECELVFNSQFQHIVHCATCHADLDELLKNEYRKKYTTENIVLRVDSVEICKCSMDFGFRMMSFPEKRLHYFTHYRNDIARFVVTDPDGIWFKCPDCAVKVKRDRKSWLVDTHMGVYHRYLDKIYYNTIETKENQKNDKISDKSSDDNKTEKNGYQSSIRIQNTSREFRIKLNSRNIANVLTNQKKMEKMEKVSKPLSEESSQNVVTTPLQSNAPPTKKKLSPQEYLKRKNMTVKIAKEETNDAAVSKPVPPILFNTGKPCEICNDWVGNLDAHRAVHFEKELSQMTETFSWKSKCRECKFTSKSRFGLLQHYAELHGKLNRFMKNTDLIGEKSIDYQMRKRNELQQQLGLKGESKKRESFECPNCPTDTNGTKQFVETSKVGHLGVHFWIEINIKSRTAPVHCCDLCGESLGGSEQQLSYFEHLSFSHFEEVCGDFLPRDPEEFLTQEEFERLKLVMKMVLKGKWCFLCEQNSTHSDLNSHILQKHMLSVWEREQSAAFNPMKRNFCEVCRDYGYDEFSDLFLHFTRSHAQDKLKNMLKNFQSFSQVRQKRKICNIKLTIPESNNNLKLTNKSTEENVEKMPKPAENKKPPSVAVVDKVRRSERRKSTENSASTNSFKNQFVYFDRKTKRKSPDDGSNANDKTKKIKTESKSKTSNLEKEVRKVAKSPDNSKIEEELKNHCEFCHEGYLDRDYFRHMSLVHLRRAFLPFLTSGQSQCPRCRFQSENEDELIIHLAEYHQVLNLILNYNPKSEISALDLKSMFSTIKIGGEITIFSCQICPADFSDFSQLTQHVVGHLKDFWIYQNPGSNERKFWLEKKLVEDPQICSHCYFEANSNLELLKHFYQSHAHLVVENGKSFVKIKTQIWKKPQFTSEIDSNFGDIHVRLINTRKQSHKRQSSSSSHPVVILKKPTPMSFSEKMSQFGLEMDSEVLNGETEKDFKKMLDSSLKLNRHKESTKVEEEINEVHPQQVWLPTLSSEKWSNVGHEWLCDGKLLVLDSPKQSENESIFQNQWKRGQPVLVANSSSELNQDLWSPESFLRDFGHEKRDLVNCIKNKVVPNTRLSKFWKGFLECGKRLRSEDGHVMLLKLKDWPPTDDIADYMPDRFNDLINAFPMPEYTLRDGPLNLAKYLPDYFLKPELGPKMYIAYGSALYSDKGSTNLHIDMSDAVNCLVHVGLPKDGDKLENEREVYKEIDEAGCDPLMKERSRRAAGDGRLPGALWHIFHPSDTGKIRSLLKHVAIEHGKRLDPHDDPIHDQSTYLDGKLRMRLYREYGVLGYAIVQCMGDTVFIPAGAAHQVRNLHNCIKVAEDFVSPENINHCLHLTQEFRQLTEWHTNHEDKLQIKNIMYHAVKNAVTVLGEESS